MTAENMNKSTPQLGIDENELLLLLESERLKTFEEWPNDLSWSCTPEKLAKAGFYFNPAPECLDNVRCAFCHKELDGWEPDDDPVQEHKKHSPQCPFLIVRKPLEDLTLVETLKLLMKMAMLKTEKIFDKTKREFEEQSAATKQAIIENVSS